jgi:outer membrane protein assembly factor BamB
VSGDTQMKPKRLTVGRGREIVHGPLISGNQLLVSCKADEILCLDRTTLKKVWKVDAEEQVVHRVLGDASFAALAFRQSAVRSVDDGRTLWSIPGNFGMFPLGNDRVFCSGQLMGVAELRDAKTGIRLGGFAESGFAEGWLDNGVQLFRRPDVVAAVDVERGVEVWRRERWVVDVGDGRTDERFLPVIAGSDIFACTPIGAVRIDGLIGELVWNAPKCGGQQAPVLAGDYLVIAADFGEVIVLEPVTGSVVSRRKHFEDQLQCRTRPAISYKNRVAQCFEYGGGLAIYSVPDGELVRFIEHKWPLWELNEVDGRLFVSSGNGILLVYDESVWGL